MAAADLIARGIAISARKLYRPVQIATRCQVPCWPVSSNSLRGNLGVTYRSNHVAVVECADLQLAYGNFMENDQINNNTINVKCSIEYGGAIFPVFFSGQRTITIQPGGIVTSDPVNIELPSGASFYVRTFVSVQSVSVANPSVAPTLAASGSGSPLTAGTYYFKYTWPTFAGQTLCSPEASITITTGQTITVTMPTPPAGITCADIYASTSTGTETFQAQCINATTYVQTQALVAGTAQPGSNTAQQVWPTGMDLFGSEAAGEGYFASLADETDDVAGTGIISTSNTTGFTPLAIVGIPNSRTPVPVVALIGDSILFGLGDLDSHGNANGLGWAVRALKGTIGYVNFGTPGEKAQTFAASLSGIYRKRVLEIAGVTHAFVNYGVNDLAAGSSYASVQGWLQTIWNALAQRNIQVYQQTITPKTNSTDGWTTTTNQTPYNAQFQPGADRVELCTWIRGNPQPLSGYIEAAYTVESSPNSCIWTPGLVYTGDSLGVHPSTTGSEDIAATVNAGAITV